MKQHLINLIQESIDSINQQQIFEQALQPQIQIEQTKDPKHGDFASNIALTLSKQAKAAPRKIAQQICDNLPDSDHLNKTEIAGPGFINFFLNTHSQYSVIEDVLRHKQNFGQSQIAQGQRVQVEFVSANPTGPLHVGHGRGAAYGACIANLYAACGFEVQREYYVNDAGRQMDILATSIWLRYIQACGINIQFPSNAYQGSYIVRYAETLKEQHGSAFAFEAQRIFHQVPADEPQGGDKEAHIDALITNAKTLLQANYTVVFELGLHAILADIRNDLSAFRVDFDHWFSERSLTRYQDTDDNLIETVISKLSAKSLIEERAGALWFLSSQFGDDKDRVIKRSNGQTTYFASDIAYHFEKFQRGFDKVVNVWGADHHGYIARIKAALMALDIDPEKLEVKLVQLVSLYRGDEQVAMSTRSGEFVTLHALREEVGTDAARFFYVLRKVEQATDFDLELAKRQSQDNPVYYVQYAHARICSIMARVQTENIVYDDSKALHCLDQLNTAQEKELLKKLNAYPEIIEKAGMAGEPHLLVNFLRELAASYHSYYNAHKIITDSNDLSQARIILSKATRQVLANGLSLLDISQPEKM